MLIDFTQRLVFQRFRNALFGVMWFILGTIVSPQLVFAQSSSIEVVVVAAHNSPYRHLAVEIAEQKGFALVDTLEAAFTPEKTAVIWVVAPSELDAQAFTAAGLAWGAAPQPVSLGIITGKNQEDAQALWSRNLPELPLITSRVVPREADISTCTGQHCEDLPFSKPAVIKSLEKAGYVTYQGGGTASAWLLGESLPDRILKVSAEEIPYLSSGLTNAIACQTLQVWRENSIALRFIEQGAAVYIGFVHSPMGFLYGEPDEFPYRYTWPDFTVGHVNRLQNQSLLGGSLRWPFYFLIGNPQSAFQSEPPYVLVSDEVIGWQRILTLTEVPPGVIPVKVHGGGIYPYVRIPGIAGAWRGDPLFDAQIQMMDLAGDKYLLILHPGGDLHIELYDHIPLHVPIIELLTAALDRAMLFFHIEGSIIANLILSLIGLLIGLWMARRKRLFTHWGKGEWSLGLIAGASLTLMHGLYLWLRWPYLTVLFSNYLRTIDVRLDVNSTYLLTTFLLAGLFAVLYQHSHAVGEKVITLLMATLPSCLMAVSWFGVPLLLNVLTRHSYGKGLYGYGNAIALSVHWILQFMTWWLVTRNVGRAIRKEFIKADRFA